MDNDRLEHLRRFYSILARLQERTRGPRLLADCDGRMIWPARGVYFFMENGETRTDTGDGSRVVRVGTHALKAESGTKLWSRLYQHRGRTKGSGGNHRGSIFRRIVGASLIAKRGYNFPTWDEGRSAPTHIRAGETALEGEVSRTIGVMPVLWLAIEDEPGPGSLRGYIERNAIGLLSNYGKLSLDPPSADWLGRCCNRERVCSSGLWNSNHVDEGYDPAFLDVLERLVQDMRAAG